MTLSLKRASFGHFALPLREKNVANWCSGCGMAHFFVPKHVLLGHFTLLFSRKTGDTYFFPSGYPSRERVSFGHSPLNLGEKPGNAFQYSAKYLASERTIYCVQNGDFRPIRTTLSRNGACFEPGNGPLF